MKFSKKVLVTLIILSITILIGLLMQIQYEKYITSQSRKYSILTGLVRISFTPAIIYKVETLLGSTDSLDRQLTNHIYRNSTNVVEGRIGYIDAYIIHCYFSNEEKQEALQHLNRK